LSSIAAGACGERGKAGAGAGGEQEQEQVISSAVQTTIECVRTNGSVSVV